MFSPASRNLALRVPANSSKPEEKDPECPAVIGTIGPHATSPRQRRDRGARPSLARYSGEGCVGLVGQVVR